MLILYGKILIEREIMKLEDKIVIDLSKRNTFIGILASLGFVILALTIFVNAINSGSSAVSVFDIILSTVTIVLFTFFFIVNLIKFLDKKAGLIISNKGIIDNSSGTSLNILIPWEDISRVDNVSNFFAKAVVIRLKDPKKYLEKAKSNPLRKLISINMKMANSPISINTFGLAISQDELFEIISTKHKKFGTKKRR